MSYRIYGKSGYKAPSGVTNDQIGGEQQISVEEKGSGTTGMVSRPNTRLIEGSGVTASTSDPFVITSKDPAVRDVADIGSSSITGLEHAPGQDDELYRGTMNTGAHISKPTDDIFY